MCYNVWKNDGKKHSGTTLTEKQHYTIIDKLAPHLFSMIFSGGEPTLVPWLADLIAYTKLRNIDCSLVTNGSLIDKSLAKKLEHSGLASIQVSWHHFDPSKSSYITGTQDSFEKTWAGAINLLSEFGENRVNVNMVVFPETVNDVYEMGKFIASLGFKSFSIGMASCSGDAIKNKLVLTVENLLAVINQLINIHQEIGLSVGFTGGIPFCAFPKEMDSSVMINNICDAAIDQIVIGANGDCRPCVESPWIGGNILTDKIESIWTSKVFEDIRMFANVPPACHPCRFVSACHGGCRASAYNSTGSITGFDPLMPKEIPNDYLLPSA